MNQYQEKPLKADKGQYGGSCNRRACQAPGAFCAHRLNVGDHYCWECAIAINRVNMDFDGKPIVIIPDNIKELLGY